jgi:hypothetical protein
MDPARVFSDIHNYLTTNGYGGLIIMVMVPPQNAAFQHPPPPPPPPPQFDAAGADPPQMQPLAPLSPQLPGEDSFSEFWNELHLENNIEP